MKEHVLRFSVASPDLALRAASWRCWTNGGNDKSVYFACRELDGCLHLSLHGSGKWHVTFAKESFDKLFEPDQRPASRIIESFTRPETNSRVYMACRVQTHWSAVITPNVERKASIHWLPAPPTNRMRETCVFLTSGLRNDVSQCAVDGVVIPIVGSFPLHGDQRVIVALRETDLVVPKLPDRVSLQYFKGRSVADISSETSRMIVWGTASDGTTSFYEAPVQIVGDGRKSTP